MGKLKITIQRPGQVGVILSLMVVLWFAFTEAAAASPHLPCPDFEDSFNPLDHPCPDSASIQKTQTLTVEQMYLPDLQPLPPFDLSLEVNRRTGERTIRFGNSFANTGLGALEFRGTHSKQNNIVSVEQLIYGPGETIITRDVGQFVFHRVHGHWHWDGFSVYRLHTVNSDGTLDEVVASAEKVGYCMMDINRPSKAWQDAHAPDWLTTSPYREYFQCSTTRQGISPGWVDTYGLDIPGQELDMTGLADGKYALSATVNPQGMIYESDETNNFALTYFSLDKNKITVIGESFPPSEG